MDNRPLDLDAVQAFVRVAELGSFTRAAEALGTTQGAISLRLKRLEARLGGELISRTPRRVELSPRGVVFLDHARALLDAQHRALASLTSTRERVAVGISDHVAGPELPQLIARMNASHPQLLIEIRIGSSADLLRSFDHRELDTVLVRFRSDRDDGQPIAEEALGWFASPHWQHRAGGPLSVATLAEPCGVRLLSSDLLDRAGIDWTPSFVGGGVAAVSAAVMAGLGVAALAPRMLPFGAVEVGTRLGLPALPRLPIMRHTRVRQGPAHAAIAALSAAYESAARR